MKLQNFYIMTQIIAPSVIEIRFNEMVINIQEIIREARHMGIAQKIFADILKFNKVLDDVNFKVSFMDQFDQEDYLMNFTLDAMDYVKDNWVDVCLMQHNIQRCPKTYRVVNSIYDVIKEFYFAKN